MCCPRAARSSGTRALLMHSCGRWAAGVSDLSECIRAHVSGNKGHTAELSYHQPHNQSQGVDRWANRGGIIAYLDSSVIDKVVAALAGKI